MSDPRSRLLPLVLGLALIGLSVLAYWPALSAGFLWDDDALTNNPIFQAPGGLWRLWFDPRAIPLEQHYWPVTYSSFWLEARLWGLEPARLHATNLALHALNAVLLWRLLRALDFGPGWLAAALFAVHPIHVESVAWIIERKDLLSCGFTLLAAHAFLCWHERGESGERRLGSACAIFVCYVLACWSKSVALSLPVVLALFVWARGERPKRSTVLLLGGLLASGLALAAFDLSRSYGLDPLHDLDWTLAERVRIAGRALSFYASSLVLPVGLNPVVAPFELNALAAWLHPLGWLTLAVALYLGRERWTRWPAALVLIWGVTLSPMLGLIPFSWMRHSFVADRFQYLASAAAIVLLVKLGQRLLRRWPQALQIALAGTLVVALGLLSNRYTEVFAHAESHARRIVALNPGAWSGHFNLALVLRGEGDLEGALRETDLAIRARPGFSANHNNRGELLMSLGRDAEAETELERALELDGELPTAHNNLGLLLTDRGEWQRAEEHLTRAVELQPAAAVYRVNLGLLFAKSGQLERAEQVFRQALELDPANAIALQSLRTIRTLR